MLRSEELLPNLLRTWKLSSVKLISKRTHMCGMSLNGQQSLKVVIVSQNSANSWKRWTRRKRITACETAQHVRQLFAPFSAYGYQFWASLPIMHISTFTYQFYVVQIAVFFPVNLKIILRNVTSRKNNDVQLQNSHLKFGIMSILYM